MAFVMISYIVFTTVFLVGVIPGIDSSSFPLDDCAKNHMDILSLLVKETGFRYNSIQTSLHNYFLSHISNFPSITKTMRAMCVSIVDTFYEQNPNVNIRDWQFGNCMNSQTYSTYDRTSKYQYMRTVREVLLAKIRFVGRLFSEMSGVRENATHIAVIYLDCSGYLLDKARDLPRIVQEQRTEIKIFLVVFGVENLKESIHLSDTLLLHCDTISFENVLPMAICKQCTDGWFVFEHENSTGFLSCYLMADTSYNRQDWISSMENCDMHHGYLAGIETQEELQFLQTWLKWYFTESLTLRDNKGDDHQNLAQVYIGLHRDLKSIAKRFQWLLGKDDRKRPLVINNWMPGQPSSGYNNAACGVWQFVWNSQKNRTNDSANGFDFVDGWADVGCRSKLSHLSLCEVVLPRRLEDMTIIGIKPAGEYSFTRTLSKAIFKKFGDNIVSVSVDLENMNSLPYVNESGSKFPIFDCGEDAGYPRYISYFFVCDSFDHCNNRRDENSCRLQIRDPSSCLDNTLSYIHDRDCDGMWCCDGTCLLERWANDGEVDCTVCTTGTGKVTNDETNGPIKRLEKNRTCIFICDKGYCIQFSDLHDVINHCQEDDEVDVTLGKLETANTCNHIMGHSIWAPRCVLVKDRYGAVLGCRDLSHIRDCMHFKCPEGYFKCPNTFCIPQHYALDGNADCPMGEDEHKYIIGPCSGNFACWNSDICLHPDLVCNGHPECPEGDDEIDCELLSPVRGFRCISGTVTVSDYNIIKDIAHYGQICTNAKFVNLSGVYVSDKFVLDNKYSNAITIVYSNCNISSFNTIIKTLPLSAQAIDISYNKIKSIILLDVDFHILQNIRYFNVSYNKELVTVCNLRFIFLEILDLSHTGLSYINESFLVELNKLNHLNLSYTFISNIANIAYSSNLVLQTLDLRGLPTHGFKEDFFNGLTIRQHLYTDTFAMCCPQIRGKQIPHYTCHSPEDIISSCFDLVRVPAQRFILWLVAVLAVIGNMTVIVYRSVWDRSLSEAGYGLFVTNLGISDIIMGVYLLIIGGADYYYRGIYVVYDKYWRESGVCKLAGFLATLSTEMSTFLIFLITFDRFLVMKFPFGQIQFTKTSRVAALLLSWTISFLLALTPIVFKFEIYSTNAMCLGLPLTIKRLTGWEYSFGLFIVYNFVMFLIIACGQIVIYRSMTENRITRSTSSAASRRPQDIMVAKQLSLVALSNFLCWFPVGIMGLLTLGKHEISNDVYAWTTVVVLPINSAANPFLYTIPALVTKWERYRQSDTSSHTTAT